MNDPNSHTVNAIRSEDQAFDQVLNEIGERLKHGESIDLEAYTSRIPQQADRLRKAVPGMRALVELGHAEAVNRSDTHDTVGRIGDYQIVRELGRGGMGVVYEAEQISLGRRVALKVLPFATMLDDRQLQRFKNEARAAATLDHPNIVSVYGIGQERGVHFYAMQVIAGQSLAAIIDELRTMSHEVESGSGRVSQLSVAIGAGKLSVATLGVDPTEASRPAVPVTGNSAETVQAVQGAISTVQADDSANYFRTVARFGIEAAMALDHAHSQGVLHRDIKPANLMVDVGGKLFITDFGLARIQADAGMTMTGDLLGTIRYMSPEQALAKRVVVDHRSDIYSLGVTLYELLTLTPAFSGDDRQQLLHQIAFEDPTPPRSRNRAVPVELDTIVRKAIERNPADRYATSADLASDLQRYLDDQPIKARPTSLVGHVVKWSRRHRAIVWSAAAALLLSALVLAVSTLLLWNGYRRESNLRTEAVQQRLQAEASVALAREVILELGARQALAVVDEANTVLMNPATLREQRDVLKKAVEFYAALPRHQENRKELDFEASKLKGYLAYMHLKLNEPEIALSGLEPIAAFARKIVAEDNSPEHREALAKTLSGLAQAYQSCGRRKEASPLFQEAGDIHGELGNISAAIYNLKCYADTKKSDPAAVEQAFRKAIQLGEGKSDVAWNVGNIRWRLAGLLRAKGRVDEAEEQMRLAAPALRELDKTLKFGHAHYVLGQFLQTWADDHRRRGDIGLALEMMEESLRIHEILVANFPHYGRGKGGRIGTLLRLSDLYDLHGDTEESINTTRRAIREIQTTFPNRVADIVSLQGRLEYCLRASGNLDEARATLDKIIRTAKSSDDPAVWNRCAWAIASVKDRDVKDVEHGLRLASQAAEAKPQDANFQHTLGVAQYRAGKFDSALASLEESVALKSKPSPYDFLFLAMVHYQLGKANDAKSYYAKGIDWMEQHDVGNRDLIRFRAEAERLMEMDHRETLDRARQLRGIEQ